MRRIKDGGGREGRGEAGWLVRWRVCSSGLPGVVRDSSICLRTAVARSLETSLLRQIGTPREPRFIRAHV